MPCDVHILEYKYLLKKQQQTSKLYQGLNQNNQTNLCCVIFEKISVSRLCFLFKNIDFSLLVKYFG